MGARTAEEPGGVTLRVWAGLGSREPGRAGRAQPTASGEEEEGRLARGPEEEGCGGATLGLRNREARGNPPQPFGAGLRPATPSGRSASQPGRRGCGERRAHTRAHTLPESMLSAALGTSCPVASRPAPSRPPLGPPPGPPRAKLGATERAGGGRGARLSPFGAPGPCLAFAQIPALLAPTAPAAGNGGMDVIPRSPRPGPRPGGQRPGGAAACMVDSLPMHSLSAPTPRREPTG